jgi:hypothetical protein
MDSGGEIYLLLLPLLYLGAFVVYQEKAYQLILKSQR